MLSVDEIWRQTNYWASECELFCQETAKATSTTIRPVRWTKPPDDKIKLNIDGYFQAEAKCGGWGFIARDGQGVVHGAGSGIIRNAGSAIQTEALACWEEVQVQESMPDDIVVMVASELAAPV